MQMLTQRKTFPSFDTFTGYIVFVRRDIGNDVFHDKILLSKKLGCSNSKYTLYICWNKSMIKS